MAEVRFGVVTHRYEQSVWFYGQGLGLSVAKAWDRGPFDRGTLFHLGPVLLEVLEVAEEQEVAVHGTWLYLQVESVDSYYGLAKDKELRVTLKPTDEPWGHRRMRLEDPSGLAVGLFEVL